MSAYLSDKDLIEKVETTIGDENDVLVEALYRDYKDVNGVMFPMMITEKQGGELSLLLIVEYGEGGRVESWQTGGTDSDSHPAGRSRETRNFSMRIRSLFPDLIPRADATSEV